jgi:hypothetical protein
MPIKKPVIIKYVFVMQEVLEKIKNYLELASDKPDYIKLSMMILAILAVAVDKGVYQQVKEFLKDYL